MAAETWRIFFWLSKTFSGYFLRPGYPSRVQVKFKGKQKTQFGLKDCGGFQTRDVTISGGTVRDFCKLWL